MTAPGEPGMTAPAADRQLLEFAVSLAGRAGEVAVDRFFTGGFRVAIKADGTEVTDADLAVDDLIRGELQRHCPADEVYGEEGEPAAGSSGCRWIIDPINGSAYFAHRIPLFDILLAYEDQHGPALGVIYRPVARQLIFAGRGRGCWLRSGDGPARPPLLRPATSLRYARVQPHNPGTWHSDLLLALHRAVMLTGYFGGTPGVLTGMLDAVVIAGFPMSYEDLAPLPVILAEAGGRVSDLSGGPVLSGPGTALISTGHVHEELLSLLAGLPHGERPG